MKKLRVNLIFSLILLFLIVSWKIPFSFSYPGDGDCTDYHGITNINANYIENSQIVLDGVSNESFWNEIKIKNGFITIPTANILGNPGDEIIEAKLIFVLNNQYIYIYCEWNDTTSKPSGINIFDGIYFCWNINTPNFTSYYPNDMNTEHMGGGLIDTWGTEFYFGDSHENHSSFVGNDGCIQEDGWHLGEINDIEIGFSYVVDHSYSIEIKRKLITNHEYDVQFYKGKSYLFNIGLFNDGYGIDHTISWVYRLNILSDDYAINNDDDDKSSKNDTQLDIGSIIIIGTISIILIIAIITYYKSKITKNKTNIKNAD